MKGGEQQELLSGSESDEDDDAYTLEQWLEYFPNDADIGRNRESWISREDLNRARDFFQNDEEGDVVFSFPRDIDPDKVIKKPMDKKNKIFRLDFCYKLDHRDSAFTEFIDPVTRRPLESIDAKTFHEAIRRKIKEFLVAHGFRMTLVPGRETSADFLKVWLPLEGEAIRTLAIRHNIELPYKPEAYEGWKRFNGRPPKNADGKEVVAYGHVHHAIPHEIEGFRRLDGVRISWMTIQQFLNVRALNNQGVCKDVFAKGSYKETQQLSSRFALQVCRIIPNVSDVEFIRNYFGERIAFLHRWLVFFIHSYVLLAVIALLMILVGTICWFIGLVNIAARNAYRLVHCSFGVVICIWVTYVSACWKRTRAREAQRWGMSSYKQPILVHNRYRKMSFFAKRLRTLNVILLTFAYVGFSTALITWIWMRVEDWKPVISYERAWILDWFRAIPPAIAGVILKIVWFNLTPWLANLENHYSTMDYQRSVATKLFLVTLVNTVYPPIYVAFLKKIFEVRCGSDRKDIAIQIAGEQNYMKVLPYLQTGNYELGWLSNHNTVNASVCIQGCFPISCPKYEERLTAANHDSIQECSTNCVDQLQCYLWIWFWFYVFGVIWRAFWRTRVKEADILTEMREKSLNGRGDEPLSSTELSARGLKYRFDTNGNSYTEDFMDYLVLFTMIACFSLAAPLMIVFGFIFALVMYRLKVYYLVHVSHRAFPLRDKGIGVWHGFTVLIAIGALNCNASVVCYLLYPMRTQPWQLELFAFIVVEHFLLCCFIVVYGSIQSEPEDVDRIEAYNGRFLDKHLKRGYHVPYKAEKPIDVSSLGTDVVPVE